MTLRSIVSLLVCIALSPYVHAASEPVADEAYQAALAVFERRIVPIMRSPDASSCSECHLSGVDLKDYIKASPEQTFVSLRDQNLVDVREPSKSKILKLIQMSEPNSSRLTQQARQMELEAFTAWIEASCKSETLVNAPPLPVEEIAVPPVSVEVIRHARKSRVFDSFVTNVWSQIERCAGCHSSRNPNLAKLIAEHGEQVVWAFDSPEATFASILEREYVDTDSPLMSLLIMKPTMQVEHGGGKKMEIGDRGYKQFRRWIEDYAAVASGYYEVEEQLPGTSTVELIGSEIWFKVSSTPPAWADKVLGVVVFPFDEGTGTFSKSPIAESDRRVWGKGRLWQHNLLLRGPKGSPLAKQLRESRRLPEGRYLVQLFCDANDELAEDWEVELTDSRFFVGDLELTTDWPVGYQQMTVVQPPKS